MQVHGGKQKQTTRRQFDLDKADPKLAMEFTRLMIEGPITTTRQQILVAAALKVLLGTEEGKEGRFELDVLKDAGTQEVAQIYKALLDSGEAKSSSIVRYTQIVVCLQREISENEEPEESIETHPLPDKAKEDSAIGQEKSEQNRLLPDEEDGSEAHEAAPHSKQEKKPAEEKPASGPYKLANKAPNDAEDLDVFLSQLRDFGFSARTISKVEGFLSKDPRRYPTAFNTFCVYTQATSSDPRLKRRIIMAVDGFPSYLYRGDSIATGLLVEIRSGKRKIPWFIPEDAIQRKRAFLSQSDSQAAADKMGLDKVPDVDTCTREELGGFALELLKSLDVPSIPPDSESIVDYAARHLLPKEEGGRGHAPERLLERTVLLIRHFGSESAARKLTIDKRLLLEMPSSKFYDFITESRKRTSCKSDEVMKPLVDALGKVGLEQEVFDKLIDYYRTCVGKGVPQMARNVERLVEELGEEKARNLLVERHKIIVYPQPHFERIIEEMKGEKS